MSPQVPHPDLLQGRAHVQQGKEEQERQQEEVGEEGEGLVEGVGERGHHGKTPVVPFCRHPCPRASSFPIHFSLPLLRLCVL